MKASPPPYIAVVLVAVVLSGCVAPAGADQLHVILRLADDTFRSIQNVSGEIHIGNDGRSPAVATPRHPPSLYVERMSDSVVFTSPCVSHGDLEGLPQEKMRVGPGETAVEPFSMRCWELIEDEFPPGRYVLTAQPFHENVTSEEAFFNIDDETA